MCAIESNKWKLNKTSQPVEPGVNHVGVLIQTLKLILVTTLDIWIPGLGDVS